MTTPFLHKTCRGCTGALEEILNLGSHRLNGFPAEPYQIDAIPQVPLILTACVECGLVQLDRTVNPDLLYREYWYRSSVNESMVAELADVVRGAVARRPITKKDLVVDLGANDGTLLHQYALQGCFPQRVAVEPALNLLPELRKHADQISTAYFPVDKGALSDFDGQVAIVTAIAMAYDTETPERLFQEAANLLTPDGILIVQFQDLLQQIEASAFDNLCHEHLEYYTLWSLAALAGRVGLFPVEVQRRAINGGSLRVTFGKKAVPHVSVAAQFSLEAAAGLDVISLRAHKWGAFDRFKTRVTTAVRQIQASLEPAIAQGLVVDVYGASTKGNITLQVLGLGPALIRHAIDRSPAKWGYHTITGIPIVSEETAKAAPADLWLANIWQFRESVLKRERWYLEQGGTILFPLPRVEVVRESWLGPAAVAAGRTA